MGGSNIMSSECVVSIGIDRNNIECHQERQQLKYVQKNQSIIENWIILKILRDY